MSEATSCPYGRTLPSDGTPQRPSPTLATWRDEGAATPLTYEDGHDGWIVTRYDLARTVLADRRFSQLPHDRMPVAGDRRDSRELDDDGLESIRVANMLALDGAQHQRLRRLLTRRFTVKAARAQEERVTQIVAEQIERLRAHGSPADAWVDYGQPISARMHCDVLGVPDSHYQRFWDLFVESSARQDKVDFIREVIAHKRDHPGDDLLSDLLASDATPHEVEGLALMLMTSGRDSVAYTIASTVVALLTHPDQLATLRESPDLRAGAVEEFLRYTTMFVTLFPRTATEDLHFDGLTVAAGQTVSVSPVGANRDERRYPNPDAFDVSRDAYGHLGFGSGPHGCIGQQLARIEIGEAVMALITAFPTLRLVSAEQLEPMPFAHPVATYEAGSVIIAWD